MVSDDQDSRSISIPWCPIISYQAAVYTFPDIPSSINHQAAASPGNCYHQHLQGTSHHHLSGCSISRELSSSTVRLQHLQGTVVINCQAVASPGNITSSTVRLQLLQGTVIINCQAATSPGNITSTAVRLQHLPGTSHHQLSDCNISREHHIINCQVAASPQGGECQTVQHSPVVCSATGAMFRGVGPQVGL